MGSYTEFHFNCFLKKNTPTNVIVTLRYMVDFDVWLPPNTLPDHKLFKSGRWDYMLQSSSASFPSVACSSFNAEHNRLNIRCAFKDYSGEIRNFLDWLAPHIRADSGDFLGFYRNRANHSPTLLYYSDGDGVVVEKEVDPFGINDY